MHLAELKKKTPSDLLSYAESLQIENASSLRKQDMMFAILKNLAENDQAIHGEGTLEILLRRVRLPALAGGQLSCPARTTSTSAQARCGASACAPATPSRGRSGRRATASATSRC